MIERVGIVGLGVMGSAMSGHLLGAGFEIHGYDVDADKVAALVAAGAVGARSTAAVAAAVEAVLISVDSVGALEDVTEGIVAGAHPRLLAIEMGTLPLDAKRAAHDRLAEVGVELMDVPVSGTGLQAADATLVVFASGSEDGYALAKPIFDVIGRSSYHLGAFGNGSVMKYIANLLVAVHNLSTAEAHALGIAAGMDPALVQQVMSDGVGSSKIFDIRGPMMVADDYLPPAARLDIILKDATIIKAFAEEVGAPTPLLDAALPVYHASKDAGLGDLDAAALCRHLERTAALHRAPPQR